MKHTFLNTLKGLYVLILLAFCLPWFTYNPAVMGYCWGFQFLPFFLISFCISGLYLFRFRSSLFLGILCQVSALADVGILVHILGYWQKYRNIRDGFQLLDGLRTARFGFWLAVGLHIAFLIMVNVSLLRRNGTGEVSE